ncbi:MAG: nucleotidyl transferase AbiEii/AbiGii toxin family protein [Candidatus Paceibacterota bacterium]
MILPNKKDAIHKAWLYRILEAIADDSYLSASLYFKGGTCASMLLWLDRFSVDLDFDFKGSDEDILKARSSLENIFLKLGLIVKDKSKVGIQYFLKYKSDDSNRNILKIDVTFPIIKSSQYETVRLLEIDRFLICQTKETMFAHKLVAVLDRFEKTGGIAGRDIYDIHYFFMKGFDYNVSVIEERRNMPIKDFFISLFDFIDQKVTDKILSEDLNSLLPYEQFVQIRKVLKRETLTLIKDEIKRLT